MTFIMKLEVKLFQPCNPIILKSPLARLVQRPEPGVPVIIFLTNNISLSPSAEQLRAKTGKIMRGCAAAGHREFLRQGNVGEGKIIPAQVLPVLQGKGPVRKEAFLLTAFLVTFVATKVTALPRQLSGPML